MGEAKRKKLQGSRFVAMGGFKPMDGEVPVAEVVWILPGKRNFELALDALGWRSVQISEVVAEAIKTGGADAIGVEWIRWPDGREQIRQVGVSTQSMSTDIEERMQMFGRRGVAAALIVFNDGQMCPKLRDWETSHVWAKEIRNIEGLPSINDLVVIEEAKDLKRESALQIKVKTGTGVPAEKLAIKVIDAIEGLAGSKQSLEKYAGRAMLTFDGLADDDREAWDVPEVVEVVRQVASEVRWWPLMSHATHAYVWIACCLAHGQTRYFKDGQVHHDFDLLELDRLVKQGCMEAFGVMAEAGLSESQSKVIGERALGPLVRFLEAYADLSAKVSAGEVELQSEKPKELEPLLWRAKFEGVSKDDLITQALARRKSVEDLMREVDAGGVNHFGIVLDRSLMGQEALEKLRAAGGGWAGMLGSDGVTSWQKSAVPYLVMWGARTEGVISCMPCDSKESLVKTALPICVRRSLDQEGKGSWAVCVKPEDEVEVLSTLMGLEALQE